MSSVQIFDQSYTWTHFQFIVQLDVLFCTRSKNIMTYMSTSMIFVYIHTIFMHNVDFKSDTYTLYYILKLTLLSTKISVQSYTWTHFQFIVQLDVLFCTRSKNIMTYMSTFRIFVHIHTIFMHNVDFKSDHTLYVIFEIFHVKCTDFRSILYSDIFFSS